MKRIISLIFAGLMLLGCMSFAACADKPIVSVEDDPVYGASIDPSKITNNEAKSVILGIMDNATGYMQFVTGVAFSTVQRLDNVDYTTDENKSYYPLASKYGLQSYDQLINGIRKYYTKSIADAMIEVLTGTDAETGKTCTRYKDIGGKVHININFKGTKSYDVTANYETFRITERGEDYFTIACYANINAVNGEQQIKLKKIDGKWYVDSLIV